MMFYLSNLTVIFKIEIDNLNTNTLYQIVQVNVFIISNY